MFDISPLVQNSRSVLENLTNPCCDMFIFLNIHFLLTSVLQIIVA